MLSLVWSYSHAFGWTVVATFFSTLELTVYLPNASTLDRAYAKPLWLSLEPADPPTHSTTIYSTDMAAIWSTSYSPHRYSFEASFHRTITFSIVTAFTSTYFATAYASFNPTHIASI